MGDVIHQSVIVTASGYAKQHDDMEYPDIEAFRAQMPEPLRHLVVGPVPAVTNGYEHFFWVSSGSKEGWGTEEIAEDWREKFVALWSFRHEDGSSPYAVVEVQYGGPGMRASVKEPFRTQVS
jgi:hypothetical protein